MKELIKIQSELKAPKNQFNSFGKYNYRSAEDILEAVKPLLKATNTTLTLSDEVIAVADRIYIKATATITNSAGETISTTALAREPEAKKGMDESQISGTASSYARKYAMNGLFCIDDNKDADTDESQGKPSKPAPKPQPKAQPKMVQQIPTISAEQIMELSLMMQRKGISSAVICTSCNVAKIEDMTVQNFEYVMGRLINTPDAVKEA